MRSLTLRDPRHLTDLHDDFGERTPALLFGGDSGLYRSAERAYESKEPFVVRRDEIVGQADNWN